MERRMYRSLIGSAPRRIALRLLGGSFLGGFAVAAGMSASASGMASHRQMAAVTRVVDQPVGATLPRDRALAPRRETRAHRA